jgi:hypothetical protein
MVFAGQKNMRQMFFHEEEECFQSALKTKIVRMGSSVAGHQQVSAAI